MMAGKLSDILKTTGKTPPAERAFELRIAEQKTANIYSYTVKMSPTQILEKPEELRKALIEGFCKLVDTVLRGGTLPPVSTLVVNNDENKKDDEGA
jgi:hypothetical protein